jgi:hypothetical protein
VAIEGTTSTTTRQADAPEIHLNNKFEIKNTYHDNQTKKKKKTGKTMYSTRWYAAWVQQNAAVDQLR